LLCTELTFYLVQGFVVALPGKQVSSFDAENQKSASTGKNVLGKAPNTQTGYEIRLMAVSRIDQALGFIDVSPRAVGDVGSRSV
jgi:hypothetical protein